MKASSKPSSKKVSNFFFAKAYILQQFPSGRTFVRLHGILKLMENSYKIRKQPSDLILLH